MHYLNININEETRVENMTLNNSLLSKENIIYLHFVKRFLLFIMYCFSFISYEYAFQMSEAKCSDSYVDATEQQASST